MSAHIVYEGVQRSRDDADGDDTSDRPSLTHTLFRGQKLWFGHAVPQRKWLIENARQNGAIIVDLDTDADVRLVDHTRKNNVPGTTSFQYVESSIRKGTLEDLASHAVGVRNRVSRAIGSTVTAPKHGRTPFTEQDDQVLWNWLKPFMDRGGADKGLEIFKQLEVVHPQHTYQSWHDRWRKKVQHQQRKVTQVIDPLTIDEPSASLARSRQWEEASNNSVSRKAPRIHQQANADQDAEKPSTNSRVTPKLSLPAPDTTPSGRAQNKVTLHTSAANAGSVSFKTGVKVGESSRFPKPTRAKTFTKDEYDQLYNAIESFEGNSYHDSNKPWDDFAQENGTHTGVEWRNYFYSTVVPDYCAANSLRVHLEEPLMFESLSEGNSGPSGQSQNRNVDRSASEASSTQADITCTLCHTSNPDKWRQGKDGGVLCRECYKLVKEHGPSRASLIISERHKADDKMVMHEAKEEPDDPQTPRSLPVDNLAVVSVSAGAQSKLLDSSKHSESAASLRPRFTADPQDVNRKSPEASRRSKSPSIEPNSLTEAQPPEPNTSRKRSAAKSSQSQSQSTPASNTNTQNSNLSGQSQAQAPRESLSEMGQPQSKEGDADPLLPTQSNNFTLNPSTATRTSLPPPQKQRSRLQDEPGTLPSQQISSLSTDSGPPPQRSQWLDSSDFSRADRNVALSGLPSANQQSHMSPRRRREESWLFVPENDSFNEEEEVDECGQPEIGETQATDEQRSLAPEVDAIFDRNPGRKRGYRDQDDGDNLSHSLARPGKRHQTEVFETATQSPAQFHTARLEQDFVAQLSDNAFHRLGSVGDIDDDLDMTELPDPPGGFTAYGIGDSIVPPEADSNTFGATDDCDEDEIPTGEKRQQSPQIKVELEDSADPSESDILAARSLTLPYAREATTVPAPGYASSTAQKKEKPPINTMEEVPAKLTQSREQRRILPELQALVGDGDLARAIPRVQDRPHLNEEQYSGQSRLQRDRMKNSADAAAAKSTASASSKALLPTHRTPASKTHSSARRTSESRPNPKPTSSRYAGSEADAYVPPPPTSGENGDDWFDEWAKIQKYEEHPSTVWLEPILIAAAEATSFDFPLASGLVPLLIRERDKRLRRLRRENRSQHINIEDISYKDLKRMLPPNQPGVWTVQDDSDLVSIFSARQNAMKQKHGKATCEKRFDFFKRMQDRE
jgi:hypothetical protein